MYIILGGLYLHVPLYRLCICLSSVSLSVYVYPRWSISTHSSIYTLYMPLKCFPQCICISLVVYIYMFLYIDSVYATQVFPSVYMYIRGGLYLHAPLYTLCICHSGVSLSVYVYPRWSISTRSSIYTLYMPLWCFPQCICISSVVYIYKFLYIHSVYLLNTFSKIFFLIPGSHNKGLIPVSSSDSVFWSLDKRCPGVSWSSHPSHGHPGTGHLLCHTTH